MSCCRPCDSISAVGSHFPFGSAAHSILLVGVVVFGLGACASEETAPREDNCATENHCHRGVDGSPACDDGYTWTDPADKGNLECVLEPTDNDNDGFMNDVDCDDQNPFAYPNAPEICDGADNDCDEQVDEGVRNTYWFDADDDGYGDPSVSTAACTPPTGYVANDIDCDDTDPAEHPLAPELCDGLDNDCDDVVPIDELDLDEDDFPTCAGDCDDGNGSVHPGAPEICDGRDTNCDNVLPAGEMDLDLDGWMICAGDCDDDNRNTHPTATELCDGLDNNCDHVVPSIEIDGDEDGASQCQGDCDEINPALNISDMDDDGMTSCAGDCDDSDPTTYAGALELCDGLDNNCDGVVPADETTDVDMDDFPVCIDCDDTAATTHFGAPELCNRVDDDCDGEIQPVEIDGDGDLLSPCEGDCNDSNPSVIAPDCTGRVCGGDGCGGTCPPGCTGNVVCDEVLGQCVVGTWVTITAGTFTMGSSVTEEGRYDNETKHEVTLSQNFEILSSEVTQQQFETLMGWNPSHFGPYGTGPDCGPDCPVEYVSWYDAAAYTNELSVQAGYAPCYVLAAVVCESFINVGTDYMSCINDAQGGIDSATVTLNSVVSPYDCEGYRLPMEAEWEYAARAGTTTSTYNGDLDSDHLMCEQPNVLDPIAWFCGNSGDTTHPVGTRRPNGWGLYDMLGNVWEWCHDGFGAYPSGPVTNPEGAVGSSYRLFRGGCWMCAALLARTAMRTDVWPGSRNFHFGFRVVKSSP